MIADGFTVSAMIDIRVRQTGSREDEEERERYKKRGGERGSWGERITPGTMRWRKRREGKGGGKGRVEIWKERRKEREEERMGDPGRCDTEGGVCAKLLARQSGFPERIWIWASSRGWVLSACSLRTYEYMYMCVYVCISQRGAHLLVHARTRGLNV